MSTEFVKTETRDLSSEGGPYPETEHSLGLFSFVPALIFPVLAEFAKAEAPSPEGDPSRETEHSCGIFSFDPALKLPVSTEFAKAEVGDLSPEWDPSPETDSSPEMEGDPSLQ